MSDQVATPDYPGENIDNDAAMLCRVLGAEMLAHGQDPNLISPTDAWHRYCDMWRRGVTNSGQFMPPEWEKLIADDTPLCIHFKEAWLTLARRRELSRGLNFGSGMIL